MRVTSAIGASRHIAKLLHDPEGLVHTDVLLEGAPWPLRQSAPEVLEAIRRQLRVAHRVLDILVPEVGLQRSRVVALIGQRKAAGVAQLRRITWWQCSSCSPLMPRHPSASNLAS
jgi:hypothetical protein